MLLVAEAFVTDEEPAADPIQRIVASTTMTERFLLHAAAGVVDRRVRQPDRVEVIDHDRRVEPVGEPGRIPAERVDDRHVDRLDPFSRSVVEPVANDLARTSLGDVEELVTVQVDEPGDHDRRMFRAGPQEAGLVQAERARRTQTFGIIDKVFAVLAHRGHRGVPSDTELAGDLRDAVGVFDRPGGRSRSERGVSATPAIRARRGVRSTLPSRTAARRIARSASPTPAAPAGPRSADPAPARGGDHDRPPAPRTTGSRPDRPSSRPTTTTRRPRAPARTRRSRPCRTTRSRLHYRDQSPGVSLACCLRQPQEWRGPWPRWWTYKPGPITTRPQRSSRRATYASCPSGSTRYSSIGQPVGRLSKRVTPGEIQSSIPCDAASSPQIVATGLLVFSVAILTMITAA